METAIGRVALGVDPSGPKDPYVHLHAYGSSSHALATGLDTE
jgi:hypothetical protein